MRSLTMNYLWLQDKQKINPHTDKNKKNSISSEDKLIELGKVIKSGEKSRKSENEITVADLTGVAVQDIMITNAVYEQLNKQNEKFIKTHTNFLCVI